MLGALEDGASVGEDGHFIGSNPEAKQKIVLTHVVDERLQAKSENAEVEGAGAFVNLHGITTAHGDAGLGFYIKISKIAPGASAAFGIAPHSDGLHAAGPDVEREQAPMKGLGMAREEFQGFGHLQRGDQIDDRSEHADRIAGLLKALGGGAGFEKTGKTGRRGRTNGHGQPVTGDARGIDPRPGGFHANVVDQAASFESVAALEAHIDSTEKRYPSALP